MQINLKSMRKEKGWSQIDAAQHLGISLSYVKKLDAGIKGPGLKLAKKIADIFNKKLDDIFKAS